MENQKELNKAIILAAIEDCKSEKSKGKSRHEVERGLREIGLPFELSMFIAGVAFSK